MLACIACVKQEDGGRRQDTPRAGAGAGDDTPTCRDPVKTLTSQLKDMVMKLSGTSRHHGQQRRGGSPPPRGRTTSVYRSGYYRPGMVQDDMAVPPATYLGGGGTSMSSASSTPAWDFARPAEGEAREWVAQVEPGVQITFVSLAGGGGNDLKRIRFSREMYDKWQAQKWWGENNERIMELYNVRRFSRQRESFYSQVGSTRGSPAATPSPAPLTPDRVTSWSAFVRPPSASRQQQQHSFRPLSPPPPSSSNPSERAWQQQQQPQRAGKSPAAASDAMDAARTTSCSSRDEVSISNASELEVTEWVIQDEPGVYITVRELADGTRELRRVRFSRERFAELNAKLWWEENKERIQAQYL
ncbi:protein Brevis radix-like 4 isoform X2 [Oryza glaberrima]|uniref:protein Brevis radix-like 4 isoform X2 n=1 Tax=Oryza glaberrima TaxID=4538 RepID=UPI000E1C21C0|nr:protein Brevis radix-like 4 isoform X2 [Oryza sativa Japonica Group]XP_052148107.1 protein Brevis radix-like 4 isoform X2 [Oryza glaberrima]